MKKAGAVYGKGIWRVLREADWNVLGGDSGALMSCRRITQKY